MKKTFRSTLVAWLLALASPAVAQTPSEPATPPATPSAAAGVECSEYVPAEERKSAERLALRGVACFESGEYLTALRHYREAKLLSGSNLLNAAIGRVFQELGYPFIAQRYYRDYLSGRTDVGEGRQRIEQRLEAVETELDGEGKEVVISSSPPEAEIYLVVKESHWEELGRTPLTVKLTPGKHRFVMRREGYLTQSRDVNVGPATKDQVVDAELVATDAAFGVSGRKLRRAGAIALAASVPLLATGGALYAVGSVRKSDARELSGRERTEALESAANLRQGGAVLAVLGVAALATGGVLYWFGRPKSTGVDAEEAETPQAAWLPIVGPGHVGVAFRF